MKRIAIIVLMLVAARMAAPLGVRAQWDNVFQIPGTRGSSAFFINANEGVIGTGDYHFRRGLLAKIFYTQDGGKTWLQARLPSSQILGEVTDIYFTDRTNGWATIAEGAVRGWSGVYHSSDAGRTWTFIIPAANPCGIRETKRGVFFTNSGTQKNDPNGIIFSSDHGATWSTVGSTLVPLGIDFLNDAVGYATAHGAVQEDYVYTIDSGKTWTELDALTEAWSVFADPILNSLIIASEGDGTTPTAILRSATIASIPQKIQMYSTDGLSGGVAGNRVCNSVVYVQGRSQTSDGPHGLMRTFDGGVNWKFIGGPMNTIDTRFAVTGRGAVVYAFDSIHGVWKTTQGGDSSLSPSALKFVTIQNPFGVTSARRCDSAYATFRFGYRACDSGRVSRVTFLNDSLGELSAPSYSNDFAFYSQTRFNSLNILYQPSSERQWRAQIRVTLAQGDGYEEDTTLTLDLNGLAPAQNHVTFRDTTAPTTLDFGNTSICSGDVRPIVIANNGCGELLIDQIGASNAAFSLASSFKPFTLSAGSRRTFLVRFSPSTPSPYHAVLNVHHGVILDTLSLYGAGIAPSLALQITKPDTISSSLCDTASFAIQVRNVACKAFKVLSATADTPFTAPAISQTDSIHTGENTTLNFRFAPNAQGPVTKSITIKVAYDGAQEYDTTFAIVGNGTSGLPQLAINGIPGDSLYLFNMGDVSYCSDALDTILLASRGCGLTSITNASVSNASFAIERRPQQVASGGDTMIVRYHPKQTGWDTTWLTLETSSGTKSIQLALNVTSDPGNIHIASTQGLSAMTCDSAAFAISVINSTCDSVTIVGAKITGTNPNDFLLRTNVPIGLATRAQANIAGSFQPQDSLARSATAVLTIQRKGGTTFDTNVDLTAFGIAVPIIPVRLIPGSSSVPAGGIFNLGIACEQGSGPIKIGALDFTLVMNTDLATPEGIINLPSQYIFNSGTIRISHDSAMIHCQLPSDVAVPPGSKLCEIVCRVNVTDTFNSVIALYSPVIRSISGGSSCTRAIVESQDSAYVFSLSYQCSDSTLKDFIKYKEILIDRIAPNPTSGEVTMTLDVPSGYSNDASIEVYDALGEQLTTLPLVFSEAGKKNVPLNVSAKTSGVCYIVLKSASGITTSRVMIEK